MKALVNSEQALAAARVAGLGEEDLHLGQIAVLTFSATIMARLEERCGLEDAAWIAPQHHPYAAAEIVKRGQFRGLGIAALVPPMGASPLACIVEDLAACGVRAVFLVCAAWSLGAPVDSGDLIVPTFSVGLDGTSAHYGNQNGQVHGQQAVVDALSQACQSLGVRYHVGGNGTCEALYRIEADMVAGFRRRGCLCMENGEANVVFAATRTLGILGGVLFQPYIELQRGWEPAYLQDERYRAGCRMQADVVLEAAVRLWNEGVPSL